LLFTTLSAKALSLFEKSDKGTFFLHSVYSILSYYQKISIKFLKRSLKTIKN